MSGLRHVLCRRDEIPDGSARGFEIVRGAFRRDVVLVARHGALKAYVNSCPHLHMSLETFPDKFLNADGSLLVCSMHGARFRVDDGHCISGPCVGKALARVDIEIVDGDVVLDVLGLRT